MTSMMPVQEIVELPVNSEPWHYSVRKLNVKFSDNTECWVKVQPFELPIQGSHFRKLWGEEKENIYVSSEQ